MADKKDIWKLASGSAADIVAKDVLTRPSAVSFRHRPVTAIGPTAALKERQKVREAKEHEATALNPQELPATKSTIAASESKSRTSMLERRLSALTDGGSNDSILGRTMSKEKKSKSTIAVGGRRESSSSSKDEGEAGEGGGGVGGGAGGGGGADWDIFQDSDEIIFNENVDEEGPTTFNMAQVELDVNEEYENMDLTLQKMLSEARTTEREKTLLMDKFNLFLQALVSFQEGEMELIDHLRTKLGIMDVLKSFIAHEVQVASHMAIAEEEETQEDSNEVGIVGGGGAGGFGLESIAAEGAATGGDLAGEGGPGGEKHKNVQGISIDEMSVSTIRETLLVQKNKLEMQENLKVIHVLELKQLEFEKTLLTIHYSKMVKPSDLQREMRELRKTVNDLQMEVVVTQQEIVSLKNDLAIQEKFLKDEESKNEALETDMMTKQLQVQTNSNKPLRLAREAERAEFELEQLRDNYDALCSRWMEGMETINLIQTTIYTKQLELQELIKEINALQNSRRQSVIEAETLTLQLDQLKKKEFALRSRVNNLIDRLNNSTKEKRQFYEELHRLKNKLLKVTHDLSSAERSEQIGQDVYLNIKLAYEKMKSAYDAIKPQQSSNQWHKLIRIFTREIQRLKLELGKKIEEANYQKGNVEKLQMKLNELYEEQITAGKHLQDLIRITIKKRRERQEKAEHCIKLEAQVGKLVAEKKMQQLILNECGRTERELYHAMDAIRIEYNQVKIERAALTNDLIQTKQKLTEQNEKMKICSNEIDSYNNQILDRVREIQRVHYINLNAGLKRDSVKNEALRVIEKCRLAKNERDELSLTNKTLRKEIKRQVSDVEDLRKKFEADIHSSNKIAIKFRERTEEVCTFIEKIKAYQLILLKGTKELNIRQMEKSKLESACEEVKKHLLIVKINKPDESILVDKIEELRNKFYEVSEFRRTTEQELNDINNKSRIREIHHELITKRETIPLLQGKVRILEENLATRNYLSVERELILKQIDEITEESMSKANYLKDVYSVEIKQLVNLRKSLYNIATQIDGMICECGIATAQADSTEKTYKELSTQLFKAELKFKSNFAPTEEMQLEFQRILWREEMLRRSNQHQWQLKMDKIVRKKDIKSGSQIIMERLRPKNRKC